MIKRIVTEGIAAGAIGAGTVGLWFLCWDAARGAPVLIPALLGAALFVGAQRRRLGRPDHAAAGARVLPGAWRVFALALIAVLAEWLLEALPWWSSDAGNVLAAGAMLGFLPALGGLAGVPVNPQRRTGLLVPASVFAHRLERAGTRGVGSDEEFNMPSQEARQ